MKKIYMLLGLLAVLFNACTAGFEEANTDPYKLSKVPAKTLITPIVYNAHWALNTKGWKVCNDLMQYTMQTNGNEAIHLYDVRNSDIEYLWTNLYRRANDADNMCLLAEEQGGNAKTNDALAVGLTLRAWIMFNITDMFGPVPFSDAFKGVADKNLLPKFDSQESIYKSLLSDLKRANLLFTSDEEAGTLHFTDATDKLYEGDLTKWRKFCNSLRVRYLMRASGQSSVKAGEELTEMMGNPDRYPIFTSVDDGAVLRFDKAPFQNKFNDVKSSEFSGVKKMCATLADNMNRLSDPRRKWFMTQKSGKYLGIPSGVDQTVIDEWKDKASTISSNWQKINCPFVIMGYSELQFALAEAAMKGLIPGGDEIAATYYENAVRATFAERSINSTVSAIKEGDIDTFLERSNVKYNKTLKRIMEQKWISLYFVGFESWAEFRRTGQPEYIVPGPAARQNVLPTRFYYPDICKSSNKANVDEGVTLLGGNDDMTTKLWWAQ